MLCIKLNRFCSSVFIHYRINYSTQQIKYGIHKIQNNQFSSWRRNKVTQTAAAQSLMYRSVRPVAHSSVDPDEIRKFQVLANKWWDVQGEFAALHSMNDLRVPFIRDNLLNVHGVRQGGRPLAGLRILDVGCGGGLLTEPLGRLGADVLGIDPVEVSVRTAELHSSLDPALRERVRYRACTLEELTEEGGEEEKTEEEEKEEAFDAIVASEVVEHLAELDTFIHCCYHLLKPAGSLFITTINRTQLSYMLAIIMAEQVLHMVPRGTHQWDKFITPVELETLLESSGISVQCVRGMRCNPLTGGWSWQRSTDVNYALHAIKQSEDSSNRSK
ncbi:ubiquinone biosynthesis O-methyltransferase, mitochondrial [Trichomycterus rosablanca]|uniref:ubiquinone biosynthesis O-methyltransferase, mitochondrial n=1 Tax=Trichomycterus rosablanca TaxID=2290929 RepID=UPI002F359B3C